MKKGLSLITLSILATSVFFQNCATLGSMEKHREELNFQVDPTPLEVHGDSIKVKITGKFPEKYFAKTVTVDAIPTLTYAGGESAFKTASFKGEKATGNGDAIPYKTGKSFTYTATIPYVAGMETSSLELRIKGAKGSKTASFPGINIGKGVITTPYLMKSDDKVISSKDALVRSTNKTHEAKIIFAKNSSDVDAKELKDADIADFTKVLKEISSNTKITINSIELISYASPEGELVRNDSLGVERARAGKKVVMDMLMKEKMDVLFGSKVNMVPNGEDWEGFRSAMETSNIGDREIIIRILQREADADKREEEIKNISKTYEEIEETILPSLRRCVIRINYTEMGLSDTELQEIGKSAPGSLTYEEGLKAASLTEDLNTRASILKAAESKANGDYRASNNLGVVYFEQGKVADAGKQFEKAYGMKKNTETSNNFGTSKRLGGDRSGALKLFNESGSNESKYNKGMIFIANGDYSSAVNTMSGEKTFNSALAKMLKGDNAGAKADLDASKDGSAEVDYLRAIICARSNDASGVSSNMKSAVKKNGALTEKFKKDLEFEKFQNALN